MTKYIMLLLGLMPTMAMAQMLPFQSIKIKYDAAGNRILRKLYDPNELENKRPEDIREDERQQGEGIAAYPNPAGMEVTIELTEADSINTAISLYNPVGQRVATATLLPGASKAVLNLRGLPPGIYQVNAVTGNRRRTLNIIHQ